MKSNFRLDFNDITHMKSERHLSEEMCAMVNITIGMD